jgi:hypothetical protein
MAEVKKGKGSSVSKIGAGIIAAGAVAAAGYYFYGSKDAKKHRQVVTKWATDMKKQVMRKTKDLKNLNAQDFAKVVDTVMSTYEGVKSINAADLKQAAKELKANWKTVKSELEKQGKVSVSRAKSTVKKVVKKPA